MRPFDLADYIWPDVAGGRLPQHLPKLGSLIQPANLWVPSGEGFKDLAGDKDAKTKSSNSELKIGLLGNGVSHNGVNSKGLYTDSFAGSSWYTGQSEITLFAVATLRATNAAYQHLLRLDSNANSAIAQIDLAILFDGSTLKQDCLISTTGTTGWAVGSFTTISTGGAFKLNEPYLHIMRWKAGVGMQVACTPLGSVNAWVNGALSATGTITQTPPTGGTLEMHIGGLAYATAENSWNGDIFLAGVLPYRISDDAADEIAKNPAAIFDTPLSNLFFVPVAGGGISGSIAATETGSDTASAAGTVNIMDSAAATETGADTASGSGATAITGVMAATETGSDTFAATGTVANGGISGSITATETGSDTASAAGTVNVMGSAAATEAGADTASGSGATAITGVMAAPETGSDAFAATGTVANGGISGSIAASETGSDTASAAGTVNVMGSVAATETGADTASGSGATAITGVMAATETGSDAFAATGTIANGGSPAKVLSTASRLTTVFTSASLVTSIHTEAHCVG